jgi:MFS family permease
MQPPPSTSPADTLVDLRNVPRLSFLRRYTLLLLFCLAQFIDAFNNSALFSAIPVIQEDIGINAAEAVWLISAFSLTFASFLLLSGKISDVYDPSTSRSLSWHFIMANIPAEWQFSIGVAGLGIFSLGGGFTSTPITLIILRGLTGCST